MAPTVRPARREDFADIDRIAAANGEATLVGPSRPWLYLDNLFQHGTLLVASLDGRLAGFAGAWRTGGSRPAAHVTDLFVDPDAHGQGIGARLFSALRSEVEAPDWTTCASTDRRAQSLYIRGGMAPWWPLYYLLADDAAVLDRGSFPRSGSSRIEPVDPSVAARAELEITGRDHTATYRHWTAGPGGVAFELVSDGAVEAVGVIRDVKRGRGRTIDHLVMIDAADAVAVIGAVLESSLARPSAGGDEAAVLRLCLPGPSPALPVLLANGFRIEELDQFCATDPTLVDPRRTVMDPSFG